MSGTAHTVGMAVTFNLVRFTIDDKNVDYFESKDFMNVFISIQQNLLVLEQLLELE